MSEKQRLDLLLVERGHFSTRGRAKRAIMAGVVDVDGQRVDKPGSQLPPDSSIAVRDRGEPFVSRAGRKLAHALDHFALDPAGMVCADIGSSTGGFTDCLLQRGAERVYAIDVGYGQLHHSLRTDERVVVMERTNARYLEPGAIPEACRLITIDVSFISVLKVAPSILPILAAGGWLLPMLKPQFEVGREKVGKGGVVRDENVRHEIVDRRSGQLADLGLELQGSTESPVHGPKGNREVFVLLQKPGLPSEATNEVTGP